MSDDLRRLASGDDDLVKGVIASAKRDAPSSEQVRRAAMNLGLPAAAAALAVQAGHAATAAAHGSAAAGGALSGAASGTSAGSAATAGASATLIAKWLGIGALAGLAASGLASRALDANRAETHTSRHAVALIPHRVATRTGPALGRPSAPAPSARPAAARAPAVRWPAEWAQLATRPAPASAAPAPSTTSSVAAFPQPARSDRLAQEIALMSSARRALAHGQPALALRALNRYQSEIKRPSFGVEALMLRARALLVLGQRDRARALAERYIAAHPGDVYSRQLSALLGLQR